jgi:hypothetical protein
MFMNPEASASIDEIFPQGRPSAQESATYDNSANFPSSPRRVEANRENAKNSTGSVSEEGKKKVSMNALQHGLYSKSPLLPDEDPVEYAALTAYYRERFLAATEQERRIVDDLIDADWRVKRYTRAETRVLAVAAAEHELTLDETFDIPSNDIQSRRIAATALAFRSQQKLVAQLQRQVGRLERQIERLKKEFMEVRANGPELQQPHPASVPSKTECRAEAAQPRSQVGSPADDGFVPADSVTSTGEERSSAHHSVRPPKFSGPNRKQARKNWIKAQRKAGNL